ncbi:alpha-D-ribose 1-methylphosphonate 5-phosphate C-P-lyase PhnJ [Conexibacter sp. JD483]|uniref:alpha-D-ribose 1-methylphosphonate 5-phosphate C-P-lyase PhnJ n=1 Tax=unclassified Conexibacter TaxID=2627773 RepID=UPI002719749F|nr:MULTISPECIES: alpha-D-ribose 1-methylphosphonate 5-phosphate C-P-lyase PhnJ [unclassified Conexibacter]MDO8189048.1 alpha-D-ribose 1-methylphosphonate 5-phosphate C-P-lyase PhnJ [Conexibacter sp. CPCC 205706]MDO8198511.1 alpha-D-ribose 1-methylphosphonate 5-phosphate C-P-lyase PhnJ [Conexibacter sp. CPCC 205762]MDR9367597.1 alpha-D-ribose 1-methylphosphonate 5-phosphate C-P-lyase PhnJ [Conexibacter sp. JD483]
MNVRTLLDTPVPEPGPAYNYAFLDEGTKREIRRAVLKAVAIPGHQVPFGSREMPLGRGWGTGGLQLSLSLLGEGECFKAIDQGADDSVNAVNMRRLVAAMTDAEPVTDTRAATLVQSRHRIPEERLRPDQTLVLQVPAPEPLSWIEPRYAQTQRMHAERDYSPMWLYLYESIARHGEIAVGANYPVIVDGHYLMSPTPIPRWDVPKLDRAPFLTLLGAGREKRIYAVPPHTSVVPLEFEDYRFQVERFAQPCARCGATDAYLDEVLDPRSGETVCFTCSDTAHCELRRTEAQR